MFLQFYGFTIPDSPEEAVILYLLDTEVKSADQRPAELQRTDCSTFVLAHHTRPIVAHGNAVPSKSHCLPSPCPQAAWLSRCPPPPGRITKFALQELLTLVAGSASWAACPSRQLPACNARADEEPWSLVHVWAKRQAGS